MLRNLSAYRTNFRENNNSVYRYVCLLDNGHTDGTATAVNGGDSGTTNGIFPGGGLSKLLAPSAVAHQMVLRKDPPCSP